MFTGLIMALGKSLTVNIQVVLSIHSVSFVNCPSLCALNMTRWSLCCEFRHAYAAHYPVPVRFMFNVSCPPRAIQDVALCIYFPCFSSTAQAPWHQNTTMSSPLFNLFCQCSSFQASTILRIHTDTRRGKCKR